jgi:hypothetical protein
MVHPGGRPREHDRIAIGKALVQWTKDHPDCLTVPHFTCANGHDIDMLIRWRKEDLEFRRYYIEAKQQIGLNRLLASQNDLLDKTIYLRHVNNFDEDIKDFDREEKAYEASLKAEGQQQATQEQIAQNQSVVDTFKALLCEVSQQSKQGLNKDQSE